MGWKSTYNILGFPDGVGVLFVAISLSLTLSPYLSGIRLGQIDIPRFPKRLRKWLKIIGPLLLLFSLLGFVPFWPPPSPKEDPLVIVHLGLYRNEYTRDKDWEHYNPITHGKDIFWVGIFVRAKMDLTIGRIEINGLEPEGFFVGYYPQKYTSGLSLKKGDQLWLGIPREEKEWSESVPIFSHDVEVRVLNEAGEPLATGQLKGTDFGM
jgi:hypothetical protein